MAKDGPFEPFEIRFKSYAPPETNAQEAATRVYNQGGILKRSDPHIKAADRFGNAFKPNKWADPKAPVAMQAAPQPPAARLARASSAQLLAGFRQKVLDRGGSAGIHSLGRIFRLMDEDDDRRLSADELHLGLQRYGMPLSMDQAKQLIAAVDRDGTGNLRLSEFLIAIRGAIDQRRQKMIDMAFKVLDKTGNGTVTIEDISAAYSVDHDPDVMAGRLSAEEALENFLGMFDTLKKDGIVSRKEFTEYYRNVSASIDNDDYFELMIRNAWHIPGGEGWSANTSNTRLLVVSTDGSQKVVMIENDLGLDLHDRSAVLGALRAQGITDVYKYTLSGDI